MPKKFLSLIVIPHNRSSSRTLSFSKRTIRAALWTAIIAGVFLAGITADYLRIRLSNRSYRSLLSENQKQKEALTQYEVAIDVLEKKVNVFEDYSKKLNLMAGITSDQKIPFDVGDYPRDGQAAAAPPQLSSQNIQNIQQKAEDIQKNMDTLLNIFSSQAARLASTPTIWPTSNGYPSSGFGYRTDPFTQKWTFHYGLDVVAAYGSPVVATADGFVLEVNHDRLLGNSVLLKHDGGITTLYGHLSKTAVRAGQQLKRGDVIGNIGSTGKSIGPHLHYEVRVSGNPVNPYSYILEEE
jgi:murein DD-endopeptidase MepM/ murein hydrolase activator NlpD